MKKNNLAKEHNILSLLAFAAPTCIMLVFMSMYQMVDAVFVSNFVGENALSALNIVYPVISVVIALAIMLASGGSAVIARNMGEGKDRLAKENFSMILCAGLFVGILITVGGLLFLDPLIRLMGATPALYAYCHDYLFILLLACPMTVLQMLLQTFCVTAGKPQFGLMLTLLGGFSNVILDYLFIGVMHMGVAGAAIATAIGYILPAVIGLLYFIFKRDGSLYLVKPVLRLRILRDACLNGASELVTNCALAIVTLVFNLVMLKFMGETGVAAITIVLYAQFLLTSVFMGFASGTAPIFSYHYGADNRSQLKRLFRMSIGIISVLSLIMLAAALLFARPIIGIFARPDSEVFSITYHGYLLFSISYLFTGINIFASGLFTAFSNGKVSGALSFCRTFLFLLPTLLLLPELIGPDGIWLAVPIAELIAFVVSVSCFVRYRKVYHY